VFVGGGGVGAKNLLDSLLLRLYTARLRAAQRAPRLVSLGGLIASVCLTAHHG